VRWRRCSVPLALAILEGCTPEAQRAFVVAALAMLLSAAVTLIALTIFVVRMVTARPTSGPIAVAFLWGLAMLGVTAAATTPSDFTLDPRSTEVVWSVLALIVPGGLAIVTFGACAAALRARPPE
jgi:hypothetical protein